MATDTHIGSLPGVTLDPRDEARLESAFGVTSNAEELVKANRARYTPEQRQVLKLSINEPLTDQIHETDDDGQRLGLDSKLADHLGLDVQSARVRGSGANAHISYVYLSDRGSLEKGHVPYADVFGTSAQRRAAQRRSSASGDTEQAARQAADAKLAEADREAAQVRSDALAEVQGEVAKVREQAAKILAEAQREAEKIREQAAKDAAKAAESAREDSETAKTTAAQSGRSRSGGGKSGGK